MSTAFAAVDLGASSGRVMLGTVSTDPTGAGSVELREVHRFPNRPVTVRGTLHWDVLALWAGILDGLRSIRGEDVAGVAVDSWAIDYGLLDADGRLLGNPVHYRDRRTDGAAAEVAALVPDLFARTGVQELPFTTIYQLFVERTAATRALLIPDLIGYWLTGQLATELTNASTTGLLDVHRRQWDGALFGTLGLAQPFPEIRPPGTPLGPLLPEVAAETGLDRAGVSLVGSHDTASAVAGVPASGTDFAYISCGTWSLVGVELSSAVTSSEARVANFSNELGVDGTVRFLRNVMGLWLLQESVRTWERDGSTVDLEALLAAAAEVPGGRSVVDPDRPEFLPPGDMPSRLRAECRRTDQPVPETQAELTRCILDSLAAAYGRVVREASALSGRRVEVVHLVGGGARNALLCQLAADACGLPVVAGPVEAAAYGNVLVQARTAGVLSGSLAELRALLPAAGTRTYRPR
jgi:rhamnulokinase